MKGPKVVYYCDDCENLKFMYYWYHCLGMGELKNNVLDNVYSINIDKKTPKWCPYLNKTKRKDKLNEIGTRR